MTPIQKIVPHGSGLLTSRGRVALWADLEPLLSECCTALGLGTKRRVHRIEHGTHHLVWKVTTDTGVYALRPSALSNRDSYERHGQREALWRTVGTCGVAPRYIGSVSMQTRLFRGKIEAFEWIQGRHLKPGRDAVAVASVLAELHALQISAIKTGIQSGPVIPFIQSELRMYQRLNQKGGAVRSLLSAETECALVTLKGCLASSGRMALVHNDLVDGNVLVADRRVWLIDWDWAMINSSCVDLYCYLSPFVRSWGSHPRYLSSKLATDFLSSYFGFSESRHKRAKLGSDADLWHPYNTLLANWLYHEAARLPHTGTKSFYLEAFHRVGLMTQVIKRFK